jgi:hypothetical protein
MPIKEKPNLAASALMRAACWKEVWRIAIIRYQNFNLFFIFFKNKILQLYFKKSLDLLHRKIQKT